MNNLKGTSPESQCLINGQQGTLLSPLDRGLAYGDGVFRTFIVKHQLPHHWSLQYQKLANDCKALNIECPSQEAILNDINHLFNENEQAVAKVIITRGEGLRGYGYQPNAQPTRIVLKSALPSYPENRTQQGIHMHLCDLRLSHQPKLAGIKHLNRLENVLARSEWDDPDIAEGLLLDADNNVIEGTMSNVFARFGNTLVTPALNQCGVSGLARERIIDNAKRFNLEVKIQNLSLDTLMQAEEILICNSLFGAWQVVDFNGKQWPNQTLAAQLTSMLKD